MNNPISEYTIEQIHIDVARNATDDFNLFHDPHQWHLIEKNPFGGPIALGFQLESLIENQISSYRNLNHELEIIKNNNLHFSNYQFTFVNAVLPGQSINIDIRKSQLKTIKGGLVLSNRISVKAGGKPVIIGYKKESSKALFLENFNCPTGNLDTLPDRSYIKECDFFYKRKYMNTSNAKNFLCGSFTDQSFFFDELNDKAKFPEIFTCSLISCGLLEKALMNHHDFKKNPMVYTSHKISLDKNILSKLKSNDTLHILINESTDQKNNYQCYGLIHNNQILFRAIISLTSLESIL